MKKALLLSALALTVASANAAKPVAHRAIESSQAKVAAPVKMAAQKAISAKAKNLGTAKLPNGMPVQTSIAKDGSIVKSLPMLNPGRANKLPSKKQVAPKYVTATASLEEGFEGWDGTTYDWIPTGWTELSPTFNHTAPGASSQKKNLTWKTAASIKNDAAYAGKYSAFIEASYPNETTGDELEAQDEWLITPATTVVADDILKFAYYYSPGWSLLDYNEYNKYINGDYSVNPFVGHNYSLRVYVTEDNGKNWSIVFDTYKEARKMSEDDLWSDAAAKSFEWYTASVSLEKYVGKTIQVAFRYVQIGNGLAEGAGIDDVVIGQASPIAYYPTPANVFHAGLSHDGYNLDGQYDLAPIYAPYTTKSYCEQYGSISWEYANPSNPSEAIFADTENLTVEYELTTEGQLPNTNQPILTASYGSQENTYQSAFDGGIQHGYNINSIEGSESIWGVGKYNILNVGKTDFGLSGTYIYGLGKAYDNQWSTAMGATCKVAGIGQLIEEPDAPYMLSYVYVFANATIAENSNVKLNIYRVLDGVIAAEPIATSTGVVLTEEGSIVFPELIQTDEDGYEEAVDLHVDTALYLELVMESATTTDDVMIPVITEQESMIYEYANSVVHIVANNRDYIFPFDVFYFESEDTGAKLVPQGMVMSLGLTYNWCFEEEGNYAYDYVPAAGGDVTFKMNSLYEGEGMWDIQGDGLYDWFDYTIGAYDEQTGLQDLTFTLQPLPDGVDERLATVFLRVPGVKEQIFNIAQRRDGSVSAIKATANRVAVAGGNFIVKSGKATACEVYNAAGQKVAAAQINGSAVIPAANLAKGLYVVKFNDNAVVKVMK